MSASRSVEGPASSTHEEAADVRVGSILFTDLVGFTEYTDVVGDAAALGVLDEQAAIVGSSFEVGPDARVVKELGDGLMLWFGSPAQALDVAACVQRALIEARDAGRFPLSMRMGLHHGEVVARGDDFVGRTVNIASRVSDLAAPGELLVSEAMVEAVNGLSSAGFDPIGPARIRGVSEPIWLYRLTTSNLPRS